MKNKPADALLAALQKTTLPDPPKGWRTLQELCAITGMASETMRNRLIKIKAKKMKCRAPSGRAGNYYSL